MSKVDVDTVFASLEREEDKKPKSKKSKSSSCDDCSGDCACAGDGNEQDPLLKMRKKDIVNLLLDTLSRDRVTFVSCEQCFTEFGRLLNAKIIKKAGKHGLSIVPVDTPAYSEEGYLMFWHDIYEGFSENGFHEVVNDWIQTNIVGE